MKFLDWAWQKETKAQLRAFRANAIYGTLLAWAFCLGLMLLIFHKYANDGPSLALTTGLGFVLASVWSIRAPINPFLSYGYHKRPLADLDESALKILSFLHSRKAGFIVLAAGSVAWLVIVALILFEWSLLLPGMHIHWSINADHLSLAFAMGIIYGLPPILGFQLAVLHVWLAKHFDEIQKQFDPWPPEKPFMKEYSLSAKKRESRR